MSFQHPLKVARDDDDTVHYSFRMKVEDVISWHKRIPKPEDFTFIPLLVELQENNKKLVEEVEKLECDCMDWEIKYEKLLKKKSKKLK